MSDETFNCILVHVTGFGETAKRRLRWACKAIDVDEIPALLPPGVQIDLNHGGGGGPCIPFKRVEVAASPELVDLPEAQSRDDD